jgi:ribonuclease G
MYVTSTPHESKVALVEDDQLAELFFERENEYTLAGSIYKGRVTRVLPGMQSAFVDVGLERDAFLYVSDFLEVPEDDEENEFEEIAVQRPEAFVTNRPAPEARVEFKPEPPLPFAPVGSSAGHEPEDEIAATVSYSSAPATAPVAGTEEEERDLRGNRRRRRGRRGRGFPESKFARPSSEEPPEESELGSRHLATLLPGESISKYQPRPGASVVPPAIGTLAPESSELPFTESDETAPEPELGPAEEVPGAHSHSLATPGAPAPPPEAEARLQHEASPLHTAFVLPGESIAKYRSRPEPLAEAAPAPEPLPAKGNESVATLPAALEEQLPEVAPDRNWRSVPPTGDREPEASQPLGGNRFILLPGESIAKYHARPSERLAEPTEVAEKKAANLETTAPREAPQAATFVIESEPWTEVPAPSEPAASASLPLGKNSFPAQETAIAEPAEKESRERVEVLDSPVSTIPEKNFEPGAKNEYLDRLEPAPREHFIATATAGTTEVSAESEQPGTFESITASAIPPQTAASGPEALGAAAPASAEMAASLTPDSHELREQVFGVAGTGTLEHEEIEGDETELHPLAEEENESEFVEMEEESFESEDSVSGRSERLTPASETQNGELISGEGLSEAVKESEVERTILAHAYETEDAQEFDGDLSFEEEELVEEEEEEEEEDAAEGSPEEGPAAGHAQVRGPQPTSGYHRAEPAYDRRRNRRPPRRMMRRQEPARPQAQISDLLKEGQEILVQIAKEPIGKKGARITSHIALPGRFLVYMPTVNHIGVSRKIASEEERQRLKRIMLSEREGGHGGFIVRTAAAGVGEDELRADIRFLKNLWAQIRQRAESGKAPALIYHDLNLVERILRDLVTSDFSQVWVDTEQEYERIMNFANRFQPSLMRRVKLYTKETPLFEQFGIDEEIDKALKSKVWLKSGGYIVINQTEALVAIDVNTGKYVGKTARLEDTIVKTNVDAIREIVRQIRLRDLGGIIVIDFIDMDERKNRQKVMQALDEALKYDRSPSKVLAFNDFGLVAITRKRVKQSLERTLGSPCPYCTGNGYVKSVTTVCNEIYTEVRKMHRHLEDKEIVNLRVNPEVAKALKANGGRRLQDLEELSGRTVLIKADATLHQEQFDIL